MAEQIAPLCHSLSCPTQSQQPVTQRATGTGTTFSSGHGSGNESSARPLQQYAHLHAPFLHDPWRKVVALGERCFARTGAVEKGV